MTEARRRDALALSILAALPVAFFFRVLTGSRCLYLRDLSNFHYPGKKILRDIVLGGEFPYWNPFLGAGQPLAANPQHEVFYPLTWLILLPGYTTGFHLLIVAHVAIALVAMYALLRSMGMTTMVAAIGALSYGMGGLLMSMLNLLPFLFSAAWLPLTALFTRRFVRDRRTPDFVAAAGCLALQLLIGEPVTAIQTGLLLTLFALWRARSRGAASVALIGIAALGLAAVQVLPAVDLLGDSVRARKLDFARVGSWSMPPVRLVEVVNPDFLGDPVGELSGWRGAALYPDRIVPFYFSVYAGLLMVTATLGGLAARVRGWSLVLVILALSVVLAAGRHTPLLRFLYDAGLGTSFRYPEKYFLMAGFTMVVFGSRVLQAVVNGEEAVRRRVLAVGAVVALAALAMGIRTGMGEGWAATAARAVVLLALLGGLRAERLRVGLTLLAAFVLVDLLPLAHRLSPTLPASFYTEPPRVVQTFPPDREGFRIFHLAAWDQQNADAVRYVEPAVGRYWAFRNSLAPITPAAHGLRLVLNSDYDATSLVPADEFALAAMALAKRAPRSWVEIVSAMSNVQYVGVFRPFGPALREAHGEFREIQPVRFIRMPPHPRYYFASQIVPIAGRQEFVEQLASHPYDRQAAFVDRSSSVGRLLSGAAARTRVPVAARGTVLSVRERMNHARIEVRSEGWAFLVMSVTPHAYWRVTIDGAEAEPVPANLGFQGVVVPAGRHVVETRYRNPLIAAGGALSALSILLLALMVRRGITMRAL